MHFKEPDAEPNVLAAQILSADFTASSGEHKTMVLAVRRS